MLDCHIHFMPLIGPAEAPQRFLERAADAGVTGGSIFSLPPESFRPDPERSQHWHSRMEHILEYSSKTPGFLPFFWIDPTEADAHKQITAAADSGIRGFKCICNHYSPKSQLRQFAAIAETGLPIHFHSGILFDHYASGEFLRPLAFEPLLEIRDIRFALAHIGNPWYDECILLHAKFKAAMNNVPGVRKLRMFIDLTPGVTRVRRRDAFRMLFLSGYADTTHDVLWGTDNRINAYNTEKAIFWSNFDRQLIAEILQESKDHPKLYPNLPDNLWELTTERNFEDYYSLQQ
jgi:predicted TIM-barrel fold metal-dependent hydrolase